VGVAGGLAAPAPPRPPSLPDLVVADLRAADGDLVLEVQNQGPGLGRKGALVEARLTWGPGNGKSHSCKVPMPVAVLAVAEYRVPLAVLGVADAWGLGIVTVELDPASKIAEERRGNNRYHKAFDSGMRFDRGEYRKSAGLPDLVVTDITSDGTYIYVHYLNQGKGATGADFLFRFRSGKRDFDGNYYYRYPVPPPGKAMRTGGLTPGLVGLRPGDEAVVEAVIDHEGRVRESNAANNTFSKKVAVRPPG
jgi:hypothetical protein